MTKHDDSLLRLYFRVRGVASSAMLIIGACLLTITLSFSSVGLNSLVADSVTPLGRIATLLVGVGLAQTLDARFENDYVPHPRPRLRLVHFLAISATAIIIGFGIAFLFEEPNMLALPRLLLVWTCLSVLSSALFSHRYTWILPGLLAVGFGLFTAPDSESRINIIMSQMNTWPLWLGVGLLFAVALFLQVLPFLLPRAKV